MSERVRLVPANDSLQLEQARMFRNEVYKERLGLTPATWALERERDGAGYVFMLQYGDSTVGTGRALPVESSLTEIEYLDALPAILGDTSDVCEVSRIAARRKDVAAPVSVLLLSLGAEWLVSHTRLRRYISYVRLPLIPLYEYVGAVDIRERITLADRSAHYGIVTGNLEDAAALTEGTEAARELLRNKAG